MGQREKARAIVAEKFEFTATTRLSREQWVAVARRLGESSKTALNGSIVEPVVEDHSDGSTTAVFRVMGPGRLVQMMKFVVTGNPDGDGANQVSLIVGDFIFKKGSLGTKPTVNATKVMTKFVGLLKAELSAG